MSEPTQSKPIQSQPSNSGVKRWLLVTASLLAVVALLRIAYPVYRQRQIVATLRSKGVDVQVWPLLDDTWPDWMRTNLDEVLIQGAGVYDDDGICTDDDVRLSVELFALTYDDVNSSPGCDLMLQRATRITDAGLWHLRSDRNIRQLELGSELITDLGLAHLVALRLTSLTLSDAPVTGSGLADLKDLTSLQILDLNGTRINDAGLRHLHRLQCLEELNLGHTQISATGLVHLLKLKRLRILQLTGCDLWDDNLPDLSRFTGLKTLDLSQTRITNKGVSKIRRALPTTRVSW